MARGRARRVTVTRQGSTTRIHTTLGLKEAHLPGRRPLPPPTQVHGIQHTERATRRRSKQQLRVGRDGGGFDD